MRLLYLSPTDPEVRIPLMLLQLNPYFHPVKILDSVLNDTHS